MNTGNRHAAVPLALELGAVAKHLFHVLNMPMKNDDMLKVLRAAREKFAVDAAHEAHDEEVDELHRLRLVAVREVERVRDTERQVAQAKIETLERALALAGAAPAPAPTAAPVQGESAPPSPASPLLGAVIDSFLAKYP